MFSEIYIIHIFNIYVYKSFSTALVLPDALFNRCTSITYICVFVPLGVIGLHFRFSVFEQIWKNAIPLNVTSPPFHYFLNFIQVINFTMFPFLNVLERSESVSPLVVSDSAIPWTVACKAAMSMGFPGKNPGVGCHSLLQGFFPTKGLNLGLLHCRQIPSSEVCTGQSGCPSLLLTYGVLPS